MIVLSSALTVLLVMNVKASFSFSVSVSGPRTFLATRMMSLTGSSLSLCLASSNLYRSDP